MVQDLHEVVQLPLLREAVDGDVVLVATALLEVIDKRVGVLLELVDVVVELARQPAAIDVHVRHEGLVAHSLGGHFGQLVVEPRHAALQEVMDLAKDIGLQLHESVGEVGVVLRGRVVHDVLQSLELLIETFSELVEVVVMHGVQLVAEMLCELVEVLVEHMVRLLLKVLNELVEVLVEHVVHLGAGVPVLVEGFP